MSAMTRGSSISLRRPGRQRILESSSFRMARAEAIEKPTPARMPVNLLAAMQTPSALPQTKRPTEPACSRTLLATAAAKIG